MDERIKHMVIRFLQWRLPEDFRPDGGISFKADYNGNTPWPMKHQPAGTNLLDANQAEAMVRFMLEGLPQFGEPRPKAAPGGWREAVEPFVECLRIVEWAKPGLPDDGNAIPGLAWQKRGEVKLLTWGAFRKLRDLLASPLPEDKGRADIAASRAEGDGGEARFATERANATLRRELAASRAESEGWRVLAEHGAKELAASRAEVEMARKGWKALEIHHNKTNAQWVEDFAALRARADALAGALEPLVKQYEHFNTTSGNQADAYYSLVKGRHALWQAASAALAAHAGSKGAE